LANIGVDRYSGVSCYDCPHQGRTEVRWRPEQEGSLTPSYLNLRSFGSKCIVLKKVLSTLLGFTAPPTDSTPGT